MNSHCCTVRFCVIGMLLALGVIFSPLPLAAAPPPNLVFCCQADNDLYRVVTSDGGKYARYDAPGDAVKAATKGSGVLILADGYPEKTTVIEPAVFDEAAKKKLRLYVEYPSFLPGTTVGAPRGTQWERAIIASDAFAPALANSASWPSMGATLCR